MTVAASFCGECGSAVSDPTNAFCAECGAQLAAPTNGAQAAVTAVQPAPIAVAPPPVHAAVPPTLPPGVLAPLLGPPLHEKSYYATWIRRVGAYFIDACFLWLIGGLIFVVAAEVMAQDFDSPESALATWFFSFFIVQLAILVASLFYALFAYARSLPRRGQSLGKQALGIRVERLDEQPLRTTTFFPRVLLTVLIGFVTLGLFYLADYLWPLVDQRRQALHDKIASTVVVDLRSPEAADKPDPAATFAPIMIAAIISLAIGIGGFVYGNQKIQDAADSAVGSFEQSLQESIDESPGDSFSSSDDGTGIEDDAGADADSGTAAGVSSDVVPPEMTKADVEAEASSVIAEFHEDIQSGDFHGAWKILSDRQHTKTLKDGTYADWKKNQKFVGDNLVDASAASVTLVGLNREAGIATVRVSGMGYKGGKCSDFSGKTWLKYEGGEWKYDPGMQTTRERRLAWEDRYKELLGTKCV